MLIQILDEGHIIKNEETAIAKIVRRLKYDVPLLVTGTPLQNNMREREIS